MSNLDENGSIRDPYENFIALSRYARWLDDKGRRETWAETVDRVVDFYEDDVYEKTGVKPNKKDLDAVREAVKSQNVMPSMRVAMTAGEALKRNNIAGFNCSAICVDSLRAFDETLLILMQGTGLGFSVSKEQVAKLPKVADEVVPSRLNIIVEDSKEGWAAAYRTLISLLWDGYIPKFDVSKVRPAGSRLKTFGGRASGPEPLIELFNHTIEIVKGARGRQITPVEAHSIMCKIAEIVVVGGVRRCLPYDSIVQMDSGVKEIQQINVGDVVATGGGKYQVIGKVNSGVQRTLKIKHRFGELECTPNHRVAYFTDFGEYGFKDASELELGDRLVWDLAGNFGEIQSLPKSTYKGHFNAKPFSIPDVVDTDVAWLIGLIHGDGHIAPRVIEISSNVDEWSTLERANAIFKDKFGIEGKIARDSHGGEGIRLRVNSKGLSLWFGEHIKVSNEQIRIPEFIWKSQADVRAAYLAGVLDSDGRIKVDGSIEQVTTVYNEFSNDMVSLCSTLGIGTTTCFTEPTARRERGEKAQDYWTTMIRGNYSRRNYVATVGQFSEKLRGYESVYGSPIDFSYPADWVGPHKNRSTTHGLAKEYGLIDEDYQYAPSEITGIEFGRKVETYDIEVEGVHQFTTDGIVVHNSALISLSDLEDEEMAKAKIDEWWNKYPHFALANNSAIYYVKPTREEFDREWKNLAESGSGERGIFNLEAAQKKASENGRRDGSKVAATNPCGEIFLRNGEFCNLSEVIVRDTDTLADLKRKVELATKIGTWQSTLTDIKYIRDHWKQNTEEERLLGVSLTGQLGHPVLSKPGGDKEKIKWLKELKKTAIDTNAKEADRLGIPRSVAITTCKPSGTVSQLTSSASGMHAWHNDYYIRTVRGDNKDPITQFMKDAGIPHEPCVLKPDSTTVFSFPRKAPEGALTRKDLTAIEHLEIWLDFQRYWCEHNPSVTISVKEEEWEEVGNWVWDHFDEVTGVSFLPFSDHTYQQAPYQDVSKAEYEALLEEIPTNIDWADLSFYEVDDSAVKGTSTAACSGDKGCESVDLV